MSDRGEKPAPQAKGKRVRLVSPDPEHGSYTVYMSRKAFEDGEPTPLCPYSGDPMISPQKDKEG